MTTSPTDVSAVCKAVDRSKSALLLEGLPHQNAERALLEQELRSKQVRRIGGFPFYAAPLTLRLDHEAALRTSLSAAATLPPYTGWKMCGGFHPDFAVVWRGCDVPRCSLLCFGCCEVMSLTPTSCLHTELENGQFLLIYETLRSYRKNRPGGYLDGFDRIVARMAAGPAGD